MGLLDSLGSAALDGVSGGVAGGVAGLVNTGMGLLTSNFQSRRAARMQTEMMIRQKNIQKELMQYQNDMNVEQWERENAYNTPASQRARMDAAGLNGGLLMSQGNSLGTGGSTTPSSGGSSGAVSAQAVDVMMQQQQLAHSAAETSLVAAQARKTNAEADNIDPNSDAQRRYLESFIPGNQKMVDFIQEQIDNFQLTNSWARQTLGARVLRETLNNRKLMLENDNLFSQYITAMYNFHEILPLTKANLELANRNLDLTSDKIVAETDATKKQAMMWLQNAFYLASQAALNRFQLSLNEKMYDDDWLTSYRLKNSSEALLTYYNYKDTENAYDFHDTYGRDSGFMGTGLSLGNLWTIATNVFGPHFAGTVLRNTATYKGTYDFLKHRDGSKYTISRIFKESIKRNPNTPLMSGSIFGSHWSNLGQ